MGKQTEIEMTERLSPKATQLLAEVAASHPSPVYLVYEAWVLGWDAQEMKQAVRSLRDAGYLWLGGLPGPEDEHEASEARLTPSGVEAARAIALAARTPRPPLAPISAIAPAPPAVHAAMPEPRTERRQGTRDRRSGARPMSATIVPFVERRVATHDRRATAVANGR